MNYSVQHCVGWWTWCLFFLCVPVTLIFTLFQTRQIRSQCGQSRRASSQCVLMLQSQVCQMRCTITRWLLKCSMEEAVAGTVETAGLTKHCRLLSCIYICAYMIIESSLCSQSRYESRYIEIIILYLHSFLFPTVHNWGGRIVWTHIWTCSSWGTSHCFPGWPCCWLYVRIWHHIILH